MRQAYSYDEGGNISSSNIGGTTHTYTYGDSVWKDLLTAYDGTAITYDEIGNPLTYLDSMAFTWRNGRELATMTKDGVTTTYVYNADGGRYTKTVGDTLTQYYYVGGKLYAETTGSNTLVYLYDETGTPYAFTYNGAKYYYEYDLTGDVIGLYDSTGTRVVRYYYTPYGALQSMVDNTANGIGSINPIRFRGYYYDTETGFYYCNSRYYDPEIGRWINADTTDVLSFSYYQPGQYNLFAYCFNNPINMTDETGTWPNWQKMAQAFMVVAVVALVVVVAATITIGTGGTGALALAAGGSAALTAAATAVGTVAAYTAVGALVGVGYCAVGQSIQYMSTGNSHYNNSSSKGTPRNNQAQNKQFNDIVKKLKLDKNQQRLLHEEITGKHYSYQEILQIARDMFGK